MSDESSGDFTRRLDFNSLFGAGLPSEDGEAWRSATSFSGDYYCEFNNVVRGVSMAHHGPDGRAHTDDYKGSFPGDYYHEPDDVLRGIHMGIGNIGSDLYEPGLADGFSGCLGKPFDLSHSQVDYLSKDEQHLPEDHQPPKVPRDPLFNLEITTIRIMLDPKHKPQHIWNDLLQFLQHEVVSSVTKVNVKKFAVKVNVFIHDRMCTIKARVYHDSNNKYALEFQRRSGDCLTFNSAYQQAVNFYRGRPYNVLVATELTDLGFCGPLALARNDKVAEAEIAPLLDMAGLAELPSLQADSAMALAGIARDAAGAPSLCNGLAFDKFCQLLQSDHLDVAYPTARLLSELACNQQAAVHFADKGLLPIIVEKVRSKAVSLLVQTELAQVVNAAVNQCANKLTAQAKEEVAKALSEAMQELGEENLPVRQNLQEAHYTLKFGSGGVPTWS